MTVLFKNNAATRLASSLTTGATTLSVTGGEGAKFPSPGVGEWFPLTVIKSSGVLEIMRCTARSADVFTVSRSQESTAAQTFSAGDRVELRVTEAMLNELMQDSQFSAFGKSLVDDADAAAARSTLGLGDAATRTVSPSVTPVGGNLVPAQSAWGGAAGIGLATLDALVINLPHSLQDSVLPSGLAGVGLPMVHGNNQFGGTLAVDFSGTAFVRGKSSGVYTAFYRLWSSANQLALGTTQATARTALGLGTAATQDVTSSNADYTAGRVPKNGDKQVCSAWVNFNGTGTPAIRDSFNVSSISDLGVGNFGVNFTNSLANTSYGAVANYSLTETIVGDGNDGQAACMLRATGSVRLCVSNGGGILLDPVNCSLIILGGR